MLGSSSYRNVRSLGDKIAPSIVTLTPPWNGWSRDRLLLNVVALLSMFHGDSSQNIWDEVDLSTICSWIIIINEVIGYTRSSTSTSVNAVATILFRFHCIVVQILYLLRLSCGCYCWFFFFTLQSNSSIFFWTNTIIRPLLNVVNILFFMGGWDRRKLTYFSRLYIADSPLTQQYLFQCPGSHH